MSDEEEEKRNDESPALQEKKPRQWLYDRSNGKSKIDPKSRPFCPLCWPPPCVKCLPDILEQNACCEAYGGVGMIDNSKGRTWIMNLGILTHIVGLVLSILSCLAISSDANLLQAFPFSSGTVTGTVRTINGTLGGGGGSFEQVDIGTITIKTGLRHIFVKDDFYGERVISMDDMCNRTTENGIPMVQISDCNQCADVSMGNVVTVIMSVITYIPTIASNMNRMYPNYDVNCQKVFGSLVALLSGALSLYTWQGYAQGCFENFYDGDSLIPVLVPGLGIRVADVNFDWNSGLGLIFIATATVIKIIDIIGHCLLKSPTIARNRQEQLDYEMEYGDTTAKDVEE